MGRAGWLGAGGGDVRPECGPDDVPRGWQTVRDDDGVGLKEYQFSEVQNLIQYVIPKPRIRKFTLIILLSTTEALFLPAIKMRGYWCCGFWMGDLHFFQTRFEKSAYRRCFNSWTIGKPGAGAAPPFQHDRWSRGELVAQLLKVLKN